MTVFLLNTYGKAPVYHGLGIWVDGGMIVTSHQVFVQSEPQPEQIKVPGVLCNVKIQEIGDLVIPAPSGVTMDEKTGMLCQEVRLELNGAPSLRTVTILPGKVINMGVVPVRLLVNGIVVHQLLEIPFQNVIECPGAQPGDLVQKHDVQIEGFSIAPIRLFDPCKPCLQLHLILKVVVYACVIVAQETILRVQATRTC
jgi:hypothetical protein